MKRCARCKKKKPPTQFPWTHKNSERQRHSQCSDCRNAYSRKRYASFSAAKKKRRLALMRAYNQAYKKRRL